MDTLKSSLNQAEQNFFVSTPTQIHIGWMGYAAGAGVATALRVFEVRLRHRHDVDIGASEIYTTIFSSLASPKN